jgi:hypothetical protein
MDQLEKITPQFIENLLKNWRKGDFSTDDLNTLGFLLSKTSSPSEQKIVLREVLYQRVLANLPESLRETESSRNSSLTLTALAEAFRGRVSNPQYFSLLYLRYLALQKYSVQTLAESIHVTPRTLRRYLTHGFDAFSIQLKIELKENEGGFTGKSLQDYFPTVSQQQVFGIADTLKTVSAWLSSNDSPQAISIEGIGGIGKTLVAQHLLKEQYQNNRFEHYAWVSAVQKEISLGGDLTSVDYFASTLDDVAARLANQLGQSHLAGLSTRDKLKGIKKITREKRYLLIIDNLETLEDVDTLVPELLHLAGKSKLLFTSRKSLSQFAAVRTFPIPELSLADSRKLIISEVKRRGLKLQIEDETINALYQTIGGIPLVLKLASAQFGFIPAKDIIRQLRHGEEKAQNIYTYIYRQAWDLLDDPGKKLLLAMLTVSPEGEDRHWICEMNDLSTQEFQQGLNQLKRLSLIEFSGSITKPLYRIHRLTTTFLQTDILRGWDNF